VLLPVNRSLVLLQTVVLVQSMVYEIRGVDLVRNLELPLIENLLKDPLGDCLVDLLLSGRDGDGVRTRGGARR